MNARRYFFIPFSVLVILALAACGPASTPASGSPPALGSGPVSSAGGACSNPWEPVKVGATWSYTLSGISSGTFVRTIETVAADGFTDQNVFSNGVTRPGKWTCSNGALTADDPFSTNTSASSSALNLHTDSTDGTGLPAGTKPGDTFAITYHMSGTITENGKTNPLTEVVSESCKADNMQSVTVAAGTFDALHLTCQLGLNMTAMIGGASSPIVSNSTAQRWFAKGVGVVKSTDTSSAGVRTTELSSYNIP